MIDETKKILIIGSVFYPKISARSIRTTELAKEFSRQGHDVTVITPKDKDNHPFFEQEYDIKIKDMGEPRFKGVEVKGRGVQRLVRRALARVSNLLFDYPHIEYMSKVKKVLEIENGYDLMISVAKPYPIHWGVALARKEKKMIADIWVADCGDPYYGAENDTFRKPFYFSFVEKWCFRKADYISIPFEGAKKAYFSEFHTKIRVIPQGFTFPDVKSEKANTDNGIIKFAYTGNISSYVHYAIPFLERLNKINKEFRFIVYTKDDHILYNTLNKNTLSKCDIRSYVPRNQLFENLKDIDFFVHFPYQNETQRSLKLVDYAFMAKPILSFENDEESFKAFDEFMEKKYKRGLEIENKEQFKVENVCHQFLKLVNVDQ